MPITDFRMEGPPADIGTYQLTTDIMVFEHVFAGITYYCAARSGSRGWILVDMDTDPGAVINSAVVALTAGGEITLAYHGTWIVNTTIVDNGVDDITIRGLGNSTILQAAGGFASPIIELTGVDRWMIRDLQIDGNSVATHCIYAHGTNVSHDYDHTVINCYIHHCENGIMFEYAERCKCYDNKTESCIAFAIYYYADCDYGIIEGNEDRFSQFAVQLNGSDRCALVGNTSYDGDMDNFYLNWSNDCVVVGNVSIGSDSEGIVILSSDRTVVTGNSAIESGYCGIFVYSSDYCTITGNVIYYNSYVQDNLKDDVWINNSNYCTVTGNIIDGNGRSRHGVYINGNNNVVGDNVITNEATDGVHVEGGNRNLIKGNRISGCAGYGIKVDDDGDYNKISMNYTEDNTTGSINIANANCDNNQIEFNTVEEGAPVDAGTLTRSYGNYDPSANAFVGDVGLAPF